MRKLSLPNFWPSLILLTILVRPKNHGVSKTLTKIQFPQTILNLTNPNPLTNLQVCTSMRLNLNKNVTSIINFVIQFKILNLCWLTSLPDLDYTLRPILIPVPINLEHESSILESHITLWRNECEPQFFALNPTLEPYSILEPKLDLIQFHESILVQESFTLESKSTIS